MLTLLGLLATLTLFVLLVAREMSRVSAASVGGSHRPSVWGRTVSLPAEGLLWAASAVLLLPRVFDLLT